MIPDFVLMLLATLQIGGHASPAGYDNPLGEYYRVVRPLKIDVSICKASFAGQSPEPTATCHAIIYTFRVNDRDPRCLTTKDVWMRDSDGKDIRISVSEDRDRRYRLEVKTKHMYPLNGRPVIYHHRMIDHCAVS